MSNRRSVPKLLLLLPPVLLHLVSPVDILFMDKYVHLPAPSFLFLPVGRFWKAEAKGDSCTYTEMYVYACVKMMELLASVLKGEMLTTHREALILSIARHMWECMLPLIAKEFTAEGGVFCVGICLFLGKSLSLCFTNSSPAQKQSAEGLQVARARHIDKQSPPRLLHLTLGGLFAFD